MTQVTRTTRTAQTARRTRTAAAASRTRRSTVPALAAAAAASLLLLSACGSGSTGSASASTKSSSGGGTSAHPGRIATRSTSLGTVMVDPRGRTLYSFAADRPHHSACTGSCLGYWPPVPGADAARGAASGVTAKLGTLKRSDGSSQLTANGLPMYTYSGDTAAGQTNGQGLNLSGGVWWVVDPSGASMKGKGGASSGGSGAGGGGGY